MEDIVDMLSIAGSAALAIPPGTLLFFELALDQEDYAYRFAFEEMDTCVPPAGSVINPLRRPQKWTKTIVTQAAMMTEIEDRLAEGAVDVSSVLDSFGALDLLLIPGMAVQLMQHRQWHMANLLKLQLVFHESSGTVLPDPVRLSMVPGATPLKHVTGV